MTFVRVREERVVVGRALINVDPVQIDADHHQTTESTFVTVIPFLYNH